MDQLPTDSTIECGRAEPALISVVVPFYNEHDGVARFHQVLAGILGSQAGLDYEIVCVDDGSSDDTLARLIDLSRNDARVRAS